MIGAACVDDVPHMTPAFGPSFSCYFKYFAFPPTAAVWTSELPYGSPSYTDPRLCRRRSLDHASRGSLRIQRQNQVSPPVIPVSTNPRSGSPRRHHTSQLQPAVRYKTNS